MSPACPILTKPVIIISKSILVQNWDSLDKNTEITPSKSLNCILKKCIKSNTTIVHLMPKVMNLNHQ